MYGVGSSCKKPSVDHNEISGTFGWVGFVSVFIGIIFRFGALLQSYDIPTYVGCSAGVLLGSGGLTLGFPEFNDVHLL